MSISSSLIYSPFLFNIKPANADGQWILKYTTSSTYQGNICYGCSDQETVSWSSSATLVFVTNSDGSLSSQRAQITETNYLKYDDPYCHVERTWNPDVIASILPSEPVNGVPYFTISKEQLKDYPILCPDGEDVSNKGGEAPGAPYYIPLQDGYTYTKDSDGGHISLSLTYSGGSIGTLNQPSTNTCSPGQVWDSNSNQCVTPNLLPVIGGIGFVAGAGLIAYLKFKPAIHKIIHKIIPNGQNANNVSPNPPINLDRPVDLLRTTTDVVRTSNDVVQKLFEEHIRKLNERNAESQQQTEMLENYDINQQWDDVYANIQQNTNQSIEGVIGNTLGARITAHVLSDNVIELSKNMQATHEMITQTRSSPYGDEQVPLTQEMADVDKTQLGKSAINWAISKEFDHLSDVNYLDNIHATTTDWIKGHLLKNSPDLTQFLMKYLGFMK